MDIFLITIGFPALLWLMGWIMRQPVHGLYAAIFASGILVTPALPIVREKFAATEILILLTWTAMFMRPTAWKSRWTPLLASQRQVIFWGLSFITIVTTSFLVNIPLIPDYAIPGTIVETANYAYGLLLFITVLQLVDTWDKWQRCLYAWLLGTVVVCFFGMWAMKGGAPAWTYDDFSGRISSTLKFENQVPSFLLPVLAASVFLAVLRGISMQWQIAFAALSGAIIITLFGTGSRTAFAMLFVCLIGIGFIALKERRFKSFYFSKLQMTTLLFIGSMVIFTASILTVEQDYLGLGKTPAYERPIRMLVDWLEGERTLDETRTVQLEKVGEHYYDNLFLGTGPKLFGVNYQVSEIHNTYLSLLVETGVLGLTAFLLWLLSVGHVSWRSLKQCPSHINRLLGLSLLVGLFSLIVYGLFMLGLRQRNLWFLTGLLVAIPRVVYAEQVMQLWAKQQQNMQSVEN